MYMKSCKMAVVVPVDEDSAGAEKIRASVWGTVSHLLLPALGKLYGQFRPAEDAWGHRINRPFGVILGSQEPELFLKLFLEAQQTQMEALAFHTEAMIDKAGLENAQKVGDSLVCPVVVDGSDPELMAHAIWHISMSRGAPLPDCGVYYTELGRATASIEEQRKVISCPASYAICMVTLSPGVETNA